MRTWGPLRLGAGARAAALLALTSSCDVGGPTSEEVGPPLHVLGIEVQAVDDAGQIAIVPVAVDGSTRALPSTAFRVRVDRYLDPVSASRQALCIQSSTTVIDALSGCREGLLLRPSYDPVTRTVTYFQESETSRLAPNTFYRITLFRADESTGDYGLRAFDGAPLGGIFALELTTAPDLPDLPTESPAAGPLWCGTPSCLDACGDDPACRRRCSIGRGPLASCASGGCHGVVEGRGGAAMGLDLSSAEAVSATAIGHVAHQTQRGPAGDDPEVSALRFGRAMPLIAPGDPGRSYLLYKILASPDFADRGTGLAEGEGERLRDGFVVGMPMPPYPFTVPGPEQLDHLVRWIASGADASPCP